MLREYGSYGYDDISRIYTYSYLTDEPHYLKKPVDPYDKAPVSPHFHRPSNIGGSQAGSRPSSRPSSRNKSAMKVLVDSIRSETPRPKSPAMNNEEPIELSHYPAAKKPPPGEKAKIERDDFPAPMFMFTGNYTVKHKELKIINIWYFFLFKNPIGMFHGVSYLVFFPNLL